jgi:hypothetical protein
VTASVAKRSSHPTGATVPLRTARGSLPRRSAGFSFRRKQASRLLSADVPPGRCPSVSCDDRLTPASRGGDGGGDGWSPRPARSRRRAPSGDGGLARSAAGVEHDVPDGFLDRRAGAGRGGGRLLDQLRRAPVPGGGFFRPSVGAQSNPSPRSLSRSCSTACSWACWRSRASWMACSIQGSRPASSARSM